MKVLIKDNTAYTIENGKLKELGVAETLEHIVGDVYKAPRETYVINQNGISVLSDDSYPVRIACAAASEMPEHIEDFRDMFASYDSFDTKVCNTYFEMEKAYNEAEFKNLQQNAVVLTRANDSRLFIRDEKGVYVPQKDVIQLDFDEKPAFIYHGALYVRYDGIRYHKVPFKPIVHAKLYMIFWSSGDNIFAMRQTGNIVKVIKLGALQQFFKTPHGVVIEVEEEFGTYALYNLGKTLELIFKRDASEDFDLDPQTGRIDHYTTGFSSGYKVGKTDRYVFDKGHYTKLNLI